MHQYKDCGLSNVQLLSGYKINETPYGKSVTITDVKGLHKSIGMELVSKPGLLPDEEVRFLRKELGLSQKLLAQTLGVAEITVRGWEAGKAKISGPADRLLRVLYKDMQILIRWHESWWTDCRDWIHRFSDQEGSSSLRCRGMRGSDRRLGEADHENRLLSDDRNPLHRILRNAE